MFFSDFSHIITLVQRAKIAELIPSRILRPFSNKRIFHQTNLVDYITCRFYLDHKQMDCRIPQAKPQSTKLQISSCNHCTKVTVCRLPYSLLNLSLCKQRKSTDNVHSRKTLLSYQRIYAPCVCTNYNERRIFIILTLDY